MIEAGTAADRVVAFVWAQFGPYHMDRCEALGAALRSSVTVVGIEIAPRSATYAWGKTGQGRYFTKCTLFPGDAVEGARGIVVGRALIAAVRACRATDLFISGYELPSHLMAAVVARLEGVRVFVMLDSKEDDKPRRAPLEALKRAMLLPYSGGLAAGTRSAAYLRRLGLRQRPIATGYDTLSLARVRGEADGAPTPAWSRRPFVAVARFVPKKNLGLLVEAYAKHVRADPGSERDLILCGAGPLEASLRAAVEHHGLQDRVRFPGFLDSAGVARTLAGALCLVLPSVEEQWGLVANEAMAFGLPLLVTPAVGAADALVKDGTNGFVLPHDRPDAWAVAMTRLGADRSLWDRFTAASAELSEQADVIQFVNGCRALLGVADTHFSTQKTQSIASRDPA